MIVTLPTPLSQRERGNKVPATFMAMSATLHPKMPAKRSVFLLSDHTGITVQTIAKTLLSQFDGIPFERVVLPFVDTPGKIDAACSRIASQAALSGLRPIVLSSLTDSKLCARLHDGCQGLVLDVFEAFLGPLEQELNRPASLTVGMAHVADKESGRRRMQALKFALQSDGSQQGRDYPNADLILIGPPGSGKTAVCLHLAMQYGLRAANTPLTDDDLERGELPDALLAQRPKLRGLLPDSKACADNAGKTQAARALFREAQIPFVESSGLSVEAIAARLAHAG